MNRPIAQETPQEPAGAEAESPGYRPLYKQVRDILTRRLAEGEWQPGVMLPSEQELAASLSVSQGTVRKALDLMTAENLIVRRQGRGTFVARQDDDRMLFHFFRLVGDDGRHIFPESEVTNVRVDKAGRSEREALGLEARDRVVRIRRTRSLSGKPVVAEEICLAASRFAGIESRKDLPNNLYGLYASAFSVSIARASERLKAIAADPEAAALLGVAEGTPLLAVERIAYSVIGEPVEWRLSLCATNAHHYTSELR